MLCGAGADWKCAGRVRIGSVRGGRGKISQIPAGAGRVLILRVRDGSEQKISTSAGL